MNQRIFSALGLDLDCSPSDSINSQSLETIGQDSGIVDLPLRSGEYTSFYERLSGFLRRSRELIGLLRPSPRYRTYENLRTLVESRSAAGEALAAPAGPLQTALGALRTATTGELKPTAVELLENALVASSVMQAKVDAIAPIREALDAIERVHAAILKAMDSSKPRLELWRLPLRPVRC